MKHICSIVLSTTVTACLMWGSVPPEAVVAILIALAFTVVVVAVLKYRKITEGTISKKCKAAASAMVRQPWVVTATLIVSFSIILLSTYGGHSLYMESQLTTPLEGRPWQKNLTAKVHWSKEPSRGMELGFIDTAHLLGFEYERVHATEEANFLIRFDSWAHMCKWLQTAAFVNLDPKPGQQGSRRAEMHICSIKTPWGIAIDSGYSLIAHETAHVFPAIAHFGTGLMADGGGDGSPWFSEEDIELMCEKINDFQQSVQEEVNGVPKGPTCGAKKPQ